MDVNELKKRAGIITENSSGSWLDKYLELQVTKRITNFNLPIGSWELYDSVQRWKQAENTLNKSFVRLVNSGASRDEVENKMHEIMEKMNKFGATDTEPRNMLDSLLTYIFGGQDDSHSNF